MSVPETKALPPAPRMISTRRLSSPSTRSHASTSASYISQVIALRASGRLKVRIARGPSALKIVCWETIRPAPSLGMEASFYVWRLKRSWAGRPQRRPAQLRKREYELETPLRGQRLSQCLLTKRQQQQAQ